MEILVAGAHGATGQRIVDLLVRDGHTVRGMIRDPDQAATIEQLGGTPLVADLEDDVTGAVRGCDAVIFAAGSGSHTGPDKTEDVDRDAAIRLVDAAADAGASRFVMLSSMGTRDPEAGPEPLRHYLRAKRAADDHLRQSQLDWTIVRPGRLTEAGGTGQVRAATALEGRGEISRDDVAAVIVASLRMPATIGKGFDVLAGEVLIGAALTQL
jgi:uncharacterized protein YbjT (DUF2867 family)